MISEAATMAAAMSADPRSGWPAGWEAFMAAFLREAADTSTFHVYQWSNTARMVANVRSDGEVFALESGRNAANAAMTHACARGVGGQKGRQREVNSRRQSGLARWPHLALQCSDVPRTSGALR